MARRTLLRRPNLMLGNTGGHKLASVGLCQIQVNLRTDGTVPGRSSCKKQERVFLLDWMTVINLGKELFAVSKLRSELAHDLFPH